MLLPGIDALSHFTLAVDGVNRGFKSKSHSIVYNVKWNA